MENNKIDMEGRNGVVVKNSLKAIDGQNGTLNPSQIRTVPNVKNVYDRRVSKTPTRKIQEPTKIVNRPVIHRCTGKISTENFRKRRDSWKKKSVNLSSMVLNTKLPPDHILKDNKKNANCNDSVHHDYANQSVKAEPSRDFR